MYKIFITYLFLVTPFLILAQEPTISVAPQQQVPDSIFSEYISAQDTIMIDTTGIDTVGMVKEEKPVIDAPIDYAAVDSMIVSLDGQKVYLYNQAKVAYQNIELEAYYIELDLETKEIYAEGVLDSVGEMTQKPLFRQGSEEYESETMRYNFETEKAFITKVVSAQGEGFIHSDRTKKIGEDVFITKDAKYTTCDADHPHFYLHLTKAKVISNKKIITGPAYLVLEDFPIYFPILPFGFFPNSPTYSSGILLPKYGEEQNRGFFLRDGGYYWAASEYFDLTVQGDIYSHGSWGTRIKTNYKKRYKFGGNFGFEYAKNKYGEKGLDNYREGMQYKILWSHSQDSKANPNQTFSASVNVSSSGYDKQNAYNMNDYLTTTKSSSISYSRKFENTPFNLSMNLRHSQNTRDSTMSLSLPEMTFNMAKVYPFRKKNRVGKVKFYEKFGINYTANFRNTINAKESEILSSSFATDWKNGIRHNLPISFPSFSLGTINFSPGISYNEKWYFKKYNYNYVEGGEFTGNPSNISENVRIDTITGLNRVYDYAYSISASTNIYGFYTPRNPNSKIQKIRHKMSPSISFSYRPDFGKDHYGYWQEVQVDEEGNTQYYDTNLGGIYGGSPGRGESGSINFSLNNSLEMKKLDVRDSTKTDEEQKYKKVKIIDNLSISSSYDLIRDSLNLAPFSIRARTTVAGVSINMGTTLDPYMLDENYRKVHKYAWNERSGLGKLGRVTRANLSFGMNFNSKNKKGNENDGGDNQEETAGPSEEALPPIFDEYVDFSIPWDFSFDYSLNYTGATSASRPNGRVTQSLGLRGNISITDKWQMSAMTNFDIQEGEFALTSFRLNRDLHCWNMSFNFVPFGYRKSYSFTISASSSMLQDLKIQKQQSHYDNFSF
nr:putative LPS assembly protein LptD [uncultured Draconibacterium sp.]